MVAANPSKTGRESQSMKEQISKERQRLERVTGAVHAITGFLNHQKSTSASC